MAATSDGHEEIVPPGERDRIDDIGCPRASYDERWMPVMHRVEDWLLAVSRI
jgi:hypothetical protein